MRSHFCVAFMVICAAASGSMAVGQVRPEQEATYRDVKYGPEERQVLDFWAAKGEGPRPLLVNIHGGGWYLGDKGDGRIGGWHAFLNAGISVSSITYRLTDLHPLPAPVHDAARAIQFLRSKAAEWNIDTNKIVVTGGSAGGCTSMWLLLHDDLADPTAKDPVLRESTRVAAAYVEVPQSSIDPKVIESWIGPAVLAHPMIAKAVGEPNIESAMKNYEKHEATFAEFSPINHLDAKDPPLFMNCWGDMTVPAKDAGHGIHHPMFGIKMKEASDAIGHECHLLIPGVSKSEKYAERDAFLVGKLLGDDRVGRPHP